MPLVYGVTQQVLINAYIASETLALNNTIDYVKLHFILKNVYTVKKRQ